MPSPNLEGAREQILSAKRVVVVEAAAGCGKTYEAVTAAVAFGRVLPDGREVLLLTHTNAARGVFESRLAAAGTRATMQTIDSLALEIVQRYAPHLELKQPVVPNAVHRGHPTFEEVRRLARSLLEAAPAVAEGLAWRHPIILVDEHQDSSDDQHAIVDAIARKLSTRVRYFGDHLQSIYGFAGGGQAWDALRAEHPEVTLAFGHRWNDTPDLRDWFMAARRALLANEPIDLRDRPACVRVHQWSGTPPPPKRKGHCPELLTLLRRLQLPPRSAMLVCDGTHGRGLVTVAGRSGCMRAPTSGNRGGGWRPRAPPRETPPDSRVSSPRYSTPGAQE